MTRKGLDPFLNLEMNSESDWLGKLPSIFANFFIEEDTAVNRRHQQAVVKGRPSAEKSAQLLKTVPA
jgi:hypothetical protein